MELVQQLEIDGKKKEAEASFFFLTIKTNNQDSVSNLDLTIVHLQGLGTNLYDHLLQV